MNDFGLSYYENYLFRLVLSSSFAKNGLMTVATYILTAIVRFHISILFCVLINGTFFTDIILPVIVTVILSLLSTTLFRYIETHRNQYERLVDYLIREYTEENLMWWKRYLLVGLFIYLTIPLLLVKIDNYFLFLTLAQTGVSFIICDILENRGTIIRKFKTWRYQPPVDFASVSISEPTKLIIESPVPKRQISFSNINRTLSPPPVKPLTPPTVEEISIKPETPPPIQFIPIKPETPPLAVSFSFSYSSSDDDSYFDEYEKEMHIPKPKYE